jgi:hypothetical protein
MKNTKRLFWIIALIAAIGFTSCGYYDGELVVVNKTESTLNVSITRSCEFKKSPDGSDHFVKGEEIVSGEIAPEDSKSFSTFFDNTYIIEGWVDICVLEKSAFENYFFSNWLRRVYVMPTETFTVEITEAMISEFKNNSLRFEGYYYQITTNSLKNYFRFYEDGVVIGRRTYPPISSEFISTLNRYSAGVPISNYTVGGRNTITFTLFGEQFNLYIGDDGLFSSLDPSHYSPYQFQFAEYEW